MGIVLILLLFLIVGIWGALVHIEDLDHYDEYAPFLHDTQALTPQQFLDFYEEKFRITRQSFHKKAEGPGVHVIYNKTSDIYYIQRHEQILQFIYSQLTAEARDIAVAQAAGDQLGIKVRLLADTSLTDLEELELLTAKEFYVAE